ncbi:DEAD/DEAH box helicase [Arthrobacter woluwensis]|uniref:restriction endonuclease n=1 Tax=Arthrobacter woluwensis TaxID=156980 RepID=UPI000D13088A|nr:DEAD/DEAH box helicase family protein [Arthrobacter woluwensis]PSS43716.1 DEAD/DEAH box helicase [Arthrobacter woluwensis]
MELTFDATQPHQLAAVDAVVELFSGQPLAQGSFGTALEEEGVLFSGGGVGNRLAIPPEQILENLRAVQGRAENFVPEEARDESLRSLDFSVEMETGTGKTYVYLRTIRQLRERYGWRKFIIVVPSVAIREGVLQSLRAMDGHFAELFDHQSLDAWVYDSKDISRIRSFNRDSELKVLIMTLASFNKAGNVLYKDLEGLGRGISLLAETRPIVILDEPQKMESRKSKEALRQLRPLFTLRYSATHKDRHHQLYTLDPVRAYDLGLVKQIVVRSVLQEHDPNRAGILVRSVDADRGGVSATVEIDVRAGDGVARRTVRLDRAGQDLQELSGGLERYATWVVEDIHAGAGEVTFANDRVLRVGERTGVDRDSLMKAQLRATVESHLQHEVLVRRKFPEPGRRVKVLSVVFIDRVANYTGGGDQEPKIRRWFEEAYSELAAQPRFAGLGLPEVDAVHTGYFATDRAGRPRDTSGTTADDQTAYDEIMRDKTKLLEHGNPRRFIFSHSALREGWDNPNVFQICTLNESVSVDRKRQEIGRGLRLPVHENGERCFDPAVNRLTVIANEHYDDFARALQAEIEEETGVTFDGGRIRDQRAQVHVEVPELTALADDPAFRALWRSINPRTRYEVSLDAGTLRADVVARLRREPAVSAPRLVVGDAVLGMTRGGPGAAGGVDARMVHGFQDAGQVDTEPRIPDVLGHLQRETGLTRATLAGLVTASGRAEELTVNPQAVLDLLVRVVNESRRALMVQGIRYHRVDEPEHAEWPLEILRDLDGEADARHVVDVEGSIVSHVRVDSEVERDFARGLDDRFADGDADGDVKLFLKLPPRFRIPTPVGGYNPDWAVLKMELRDGRLRDVAVVAETKSTHRQDALRPEEQRKMACGRAHFAALGVRYQAPVVDASEI